MIVGLAVVLLLGVAVVTDASAAYLQRQGLDTVADGAAIAGADQGATGRETYIRGLGHARLDQTEAAARAAVHRYLATTGAYARYPGLAVSVHVDSARQQVVVAVSAPLHLPLTIPGSPSSTSIGSTGSATVAIDP
jgi:hypothetical protein